MEFFDIDFLLDIEDSSSISSDSRTGSIIYQGLESNYDNIPLLQDFFIDNKVLPMFGINISPSFGHRIVIDTIDISHVNAMRLQCNGTNQSIAGLYCLD